MKFAFDVGDAQRHHIEFSWDSFWGTSWVSIDGKKFKTSGITMASERRYILKDDTPAGWKFPLPVNIARTQEGKFHRAYMDIQLVKHWTLNLDGPEPHQVVIEKERKRWLAGLRPQKYRVFVDGVLLLEHEGF